MSNDRGLLSSGLGSVLRNKRYIVWFYLLNVFLGLFGTVAFANQAGTILDHSLLSQRLLHGFSLGAFIEMIARPEFGPTMASRGPAIFFALLFMVATTLFLPGVFQGYASTYRLPREDFFRACGWNLWRFIRLTLISGILMVIATGALFGLNGALVKKAGESTNELLPVEIQLVGLAIIYLIMTAFRIWFDLSEADIVLNDQRAVRKSIREGLRHTFHSMGRLLVSYVVATIVAAIILAAGLLFWEHFVPSASVVGAFLVSQVTLLLLLIPRFWQRGIAVSYWQQRMLVPVVPVRSIEPEPVSVAVISDGAPALPDAPLPTPGS